jgi:hypothetical protein
LVRPYQTGIPPVRLLALVWAHNPDSSTSLILSVYHNYTYNSTSHSIKIDLQKL